MSISVAPRAKDLDLAPSPKPTKRKIRLPAPTAQNPYPDRKRWTQTECDAMETLGVLVPGEYELLNGEIIKKVGQFVLHSRANMRVCLALTLTFGADYVLMPVSVPVNTENMPEPDASVTKETTDFYIAQKKPLPSDLRLAVEISDATLWRDLNTKMLLYAQAGVPEYWALDVNKRILWVHRDPTPSGYADIKPYKETDTILPQAAPTGTTPLLVADLLP